MDRLLRLNPRDSTVCARSKSGERRAQKQNCIAIIGKRKGRNARSDNGSWSRNGPSVNGATAIWDWLGRTKPDWLNESLIPSHLDLRKEIDAAPSGSTCEST